MSRVRLTNLEKVLWPEDGYTKAHLIKYLVAVSPVLLPHLRDRPLVFTRYPDGIHGKSFYQKQKGPYAPRWIRSFVDHGGAGDIEYVLACDVEDLIWIGNQASIEIHAWLSRTFETDCPDTAVFDLDPAPPAGLPEVVQVAKTIRECLRTLGLESFPKTSGATGLHIYLPIQPRYHYSRVRSFVQRVAQVVSDVMPGKVTLDRAVDRRSGRVYVDYLQNTRGKTIVAPYSPRAFDGAPVSTPIAWDELEGLDPARFTIETVPTRVRLLGDLFSPVLHTRQELDAAMKLLGIDPTTSGYPRPDDLP